MRATIYARVSTLDQNPENRSRSCAATCSRAAGMRPSTSTEAYRVPVSERPALSRLLADARRRRFDVLVCWRLDRFGRNLRQLVTAIDELHALGIAFVSLGEGIDATTPAGRLQLHVLAAIAEFERARIAERVQAGLARAKARGRFGSPSDIDCA